MWGCGLKSDTRYLFYAQILSPPMWGCGLKYDTWPGNDRLGRHPLCGGVDWNRVLPGLTRRRKSSPPMWGCGLKYADRDVTGQPRRHPLCGGVDWNPKAGKPGAQAPGHPLCGGVDWNRLRSWQRQAQSVTPYVGVWIEIYATHKRRRSGRRHPLCGGVDWNCKEKRFCSSPGGHPLCGGVDWNCMYKAFEHLLSMSPPMWGCGLK